MTNKAKLIDHTLLAPDATTEAVRKLCDEAKAAGFWSVCVSPNRVSLAKSELSGSDIKVCTVIGFPSGAHCTEVKKAETVQAVMDGAQEVDMVVDLGAIKDGDWCAVQRDIAAVVQAAGAEVLVKVILETCLLTDEEIVQACQCAQKSGADFVKTSTGFSRSGASSHAVALMRKTVGSKMGVKASGGIRTSASMDEMISAGANRIGASAGIKLLGEKA